MFLTVLNSFRYGSSIRYSSFHSPSLCEKAFSGCLAGHKKRTYAWRAFIVHFTLLTSSDEQLFD